MSETNYAPYSDCFNTNPPINFGVITDQEREQAIKQIEMLIETTKERLKD